MVAKKLKRLFAYSKGEFGYIYKAFFAVLSLTFVLNIYSFCFSKLGFAFADEETATDTLQSIISTSTILNLTSTDSIATTSIITDGGADVFSEVDLTFPDSSSPSSTAAVSSSSNDSEADASSTDEEQATSADNISNATSTSILNISSTSTELTSIADSTSTEDISTTSTSSVSNAGEGQATSTENNGATNATSTNATSTVQTDESTSTDAKSNSQEADTSTTTDLLSENADKVSTSTNNLNGKTVVVGVISPILGGTFKSGIVPVIVSFNKNVYVVGKPQLMLSTGNPEVTAVDYRSGSGSGYLFFLYSIKKGNFSPVLDYANSSALNLNGGSIKDENGNDVVLTLPNPGDAGSLSASSKISIKKI